MTTQTKHTPLPFAILGGKCAPPMGQGYLIVNESHGPVAFVTCNWIPEGQDEANAEFILRAVNTHYQLVEALTACLNAAPSLDHVEAGARARAALALAEKGME